MTAVTYESDAGPFEENGTDDRIVGKMIAARDVGIVENINVVGGNRLAVTFDHGAYCVATAAGMNRNTVCLCDDPTVPVAKKAGEVVADAEDGASRSAHHHPAHLLRDMVELFLDQRELNGIDRHAFGALSANSITKLLASSTLRRSPWSMRIVVVASSIRAGPSIV